jgi:hypothetical protein
MSAFRLTLAAALALLAACADVGRGELEGRLQGLVGLGEPQLIQRMGGVPTRVVEQGRTRYLSWMLLWPERPGGTVTPAEAQAEGRFCEATFALEDGRVAGYGLRGERCGPDAWPDAARA